MPTRAWQCHATCACSKPRDRRERAGAQGCCHAEVARSARRPAEHGLQGHVGGAGQRSGRGHGGRHAVRSRRHRDPARRDRRPADAAASGGARFGRVLGLAAVVIALVVVATIMVVDHVRSPADVVRVLLLGVSLAVAAVPEGLPAILSVVLALGVQRMARRHAIVKKLASVETLGSASVIATDKTGTLTRNEMTIVRVVTVSGASDITGVGYAPFGQVQHGGVALQRGAQFEENVAVLSGGSLAGNAALQQIAGGGWEIQGDPTEAAFLVAEHKLGGTARRKKRFTRIGEIPFTSDRKMMSTIEADHDHDDAPVVIAKGAPGVLLAQDLGLRARGAAPQTLAVAYRPLDAGESPDTHTGLDGLEPEADLRRHGGHHRPASGRSCGGHARGACRHPRHHDHRGPPAHGAAHRRRSRHRDRWSRSASPRFDGHRTRCAGRAWCTSVCRSGAQDLGLRARGAAPQAAHRPRAAVWRRRGCDDRRRRQRCSRAEGRGHRYRHGYHRHRGDQTGGAHDPGRRRLRHHRRRRARRPRRARQHPQVPALPAAVQPGRSADGLPGRGRCGHHRLEGERRRPGRCRQRPGAAVAGDADPRINSSPTPGRLWPWAWTSSRKT